MWNWITACRFVDGSIQTHWKLGWEPQREGPDLCKRKSMYWLNLLNCKMSCLIPCEDFYFWWMSICNVITFWCMWLMHWIWTSYKHTIFLPFESLNPSVRPMQFAKWEYFRWLNRGVVAYFCNLLFNLMTVVLSGSSSLPSMMMLLVGDFVSFSLRVRLSSQVRIRYFLNDAAVCLLSCWTYFPRSPIRCFQSRRSFYIRRMKWRGI